MARTRVPREVSRDRVRAALVDAARALFDEIGFEAATTAGIAARAGVSQRTLFRHFACKEDVVLHWLDDWNVRVCDRLRRRPVDESPLEALRRALDPFCHLPAGDAERSRWMHGLARKAPSLTARLLGKCAVWEAQIAAALVERGVDPVRAVFLGNFAIGILNVAFREPPPGDAPGVEALIDAGFAILRGRPGALRAPDDDI